MMIYFFIFLLFSGIYRLYDSRQRFLFEQQKDERIHSIPDEDVKQLWLNLSKLNIQYAKFFKRYGFFITTCSIINILLFIHTQLTVDDLIGSDVIKIILPTIVTLVLGWIILGENTRHRNSQSFMLTFQMEKKKIYRLYKEYNFSKRNKWKDYHHFYENDFHIVNNWIGKEKTIVTGSVIYYTSWLLLVILITTFHLTIFLR